MHCHRNCHRNWSTTADESCRAVRVESESCPLFVNCFELSKTRLRRNGDEPKVSSSPPHSGHLAVTESSVALPPDVRDYIMIVAFHRPPCPRCKATTSLARITRGRSGFDIRTFECRACDHIYQRVVELADPMESTQTAGWFRGELRAPT